MESSRGKEVFQFLLLNPESTIAGRHSAARHRPGRIGGIGRVSRSLIAANPDTVAKIVGGNPKAIGSLGIGTQAKRQCRI